MSFLLRNGAVLRTLWNYEKFTRPEGYIAFLHTDDDASF